MVPHVVDHLRSFQQLSLISVTHRTVASVAEREGEAVQVHLFCAQTFSPQESCGVSLLIIQDPDLETQLLIYPGSFPGVNQVRR